MPDNNLEITLSLNDQATAEAKARMKSLGNESTSATDAIKKGFKEAHAGVREFHQMVGTAVFAVAALTATTKTWAEHNTQTRDALDSIGISTKNLTASIGSLLAPSIIALAKVLEEATKFMIGLINELGKAWQYVFEKITFATQFYVAFFTELKAGTDKAHAFSDAMQIAGMATDKMGKEFAASMKENIPQMDEFTAKMKQFNDAQKVVDNMFLSGQINAREYFNLLTSSTMAAVQANQEMARSVQQLAVLENQTKNTGLMKFKEDISQRVSFLKFYQDEFSKAHISISKIATTVASSLQTNMTSALTAMITGAKSASQAFKDLGTALISMVVGFLMEWIVANTIMWALQKAGLLATEASTLAVARNLTAAWYPAAVFAAVATLGAAGAAGAAGLLTAGAAGMGVIAAGRAINVASQMQGGGQVLGTGGGGGFAVGTPTVPRDMFTQVHKGETIIPETFADSIRRGDLSLSGPGGGGQGGIQINIYGGNFNSRQMVRDLAEQIGFEIDRKLRGARTA